MSSHKGDVIVNFSFDVIFGGQLCIQVHLSQGSAITFAGFVKKLRKLAQTSFTYTKSGWFSRSTMPVCLQESNLLFHAMSDTEKFPDGAFNFGMHVSQNSQSKRLQRLPST